MLPALELGHKLVALGACQRLVQRCGCQQAPDAVVEVLTRIVRLQEISQLLDPRSSIGSTGQGRRHPDGQRGERGAGVWRIDALERLEPDVEPLPGTVGALQLPETRHRKACRVTRLA